MKHNATVVSADIEPGGMVNISYSYFDDIGIFKHRVNIHTILEYIQPYDKKLFIYGLYGKALEYLLSMNKLFDIFYYRGEEI